MKQMRRQGVLLSLLLAMNSAFADTAYITDTVTVAVFPAADLQGEPVERLLSGSRVDVLQRVDGVAEVKTDAGNTGWMRSGFLTADLPAVIQLESTEDELTKLKGRLSGANDKIAKLEKQQSGFKQEAASAKKDMGWMKAELEKARDKAAALEELLAAQRSEVSEVDQQASGLEQKIATLQAEKDDLQQRLAAAMMINDDMADESGSGSDGWLRWSMAALVVGVLLGFAAGFYWIDRRVRRRFGGVRVY